MWDNPRELNAMALLLTIAAAVTIAWGGVAWAVRQPLFALRQLVIDGALVRANPAHLEAVIREELKGTFFTMRLADARMSLEKVPWVREVELRRRWPGRLEVTITEHEPLARWNDTALVDTQGEVFAADYDAELPQFRGPDGSAREIAASYDEFTNALRSIGLAIGETRLSERGGWQLKTTGTPPLTIELGRAEPAERLARFVAFYPRTVAALVRAGRRVDYADLRYRNGFAARVPGFTEKTPKKAAANKAPDRI